MADKVLGGRYTVQDKIGIGGMATVYRGLDTILGRMVAIKMMLPQYASDQSFAARFKQEAQAAAALQSPYIVNVYDWGKDGDTYYIVMEYLRGTDLKSGIQKHGALDCKKVAQIGTQICQALSVAHKHDIIHRDIKPQNIMVQPDGTIKVMDFGIAHAKNSHLTTENSVLGTAHYVSPEQTQGKKLGPESDLYSLGIVMYEAATGHVPFDGSDAISVALKQVNDQPKPPSQLNPNIDATLESIILQCIQKDPAARFHSADELRRALNDYLSGRSVALGTPTAMLSASPTHRLGKTHTVSDPTQTITRVSSSRMGKTPQQGMSATEEAHHSAKSRRTKIIVGVVGSLILLCLACILAINIFFPKSDTRPVPNLLGLTVEQARTTISADNHFKLGTVKEQYSNDSDKGKIIDQNPNSGRQAGKDTAVNIVVSKGAEPASIVVVPDLLGKTVSEAESALMKQGLKIKTGDSIVSDTVAVGEVAKQDPAGNSRAKTGDTVTVNLSKGPDKITVPNVSGKSLNSAKSVLEESGFKTSTKYKHDDTVSNGFVIETQPSAGAKEDKGATIEMYISLGPTPKSVPQQPAPTTASPRPTSPSQPSPSTGAASSVGSHSSSNDVPAHR